MNVLLAATVSLAWALVMPKPLQPPADLPTSSPGSPTSLPGGTRLSFFQQGGGLGGRVELQLEALSQICNPWQMVFTYMMCAPDIHRFELTLKSVVRNRVLQWITDSFKGMYTSGMCFL